MFYKGNGHGCRQTTSEGAKSVSNSDPASRSVSIQEVQGADIGRSRLFRVSGFLLALMFAGATLL
jgi:hypothetical protein